MKTFAIANQKGGIGKTTTADAFSAWLAGQGARVLAVDMDAQCNLTAAYGLPPDTGATIADLMAGKCSGPDAITRGARTDLIRGSTLLDEAPNLNALRIALSEVAPDYDACVIDTAPAFSRLTLSALIAADFLICPTSADAFGLSGLDTILRNWQTVRAKFPVAFGGVILTKHNDRTRIGHLARERANQWGAQHGIFVAPTAIRESVAIREAQLLGRSVFDHAPEGNAAKDYGAAFSEIINHQTEQTP